MSRLRAAASRIVGAIRDAAAGSAISAAELEAHLQHHIDDNLRSGMTPAEARRSAVLELGGVEQTKEAYRDRRGFPWLDAAVRDVRYAARVLRKRSGLHAVAVLTLGAWHRRQHGDLQRRQRGAAAPAALHRFVAARSDFLHRFDGRHPERCRLRIPTTRIGSAARQVFPACPRSSRERC